MSIFEKASKAKLRFSTSRGQLSTEDLWDLSLESLDQIAVAIDKALETAGKKSFIGKRDTTNTTLELQLEILKHIIEVKLAEKDAKAKRAEKSAKVAELKALIAEKSVEELRGKSTQELLAELDTIEKEE